MYSLTVKSYKNRTETIKIIKNATNSPMGEISNRIDNKQPIITLDQYKNDNFKLLMDLYNQLKAIETEAEFFDETYKEILQIEVVNNYYKMFLEELNNIEAMH